VPDLGINIYKPGCSYPQCSKSLSEPNSIAVFVYSIVLLDHRFSPSTDITGHTPVKQSVQRQIRATVLSLWKIEPETLEAIWPKKEGLVHVKWSVLLIISTGPILFFFNACVVENTYQCTPSMRNRYFFNTLTARFTQHYDYCINVIQWASF
jgi:Pre-PUA-like domain